MSVVLERGIDTWRLARYLDDDRDIERVAAMAPNGLLPELGLGHRVGLLPGQRMLWIEGHPLVDGLARPADLVEHEQGLLEGLKLAGVPVGRDAGAARVDSTVTMRFEARDGLAALAGIAALDVPRMKPAVYGKPPQTVYLQGARTRKVFGRVYDKGVEADIAAPGELLRFEDQRRFTKETRRAVKDLQPEQDFAKRFAAMHRSADGVHVRSVAAMRRELAERVNGGEMDYRQAERLAGHMVLEEIGARHSKRTAQRRSAEMRERGLVLADAFYEDVDVDLGTVFDEVMAAW